MAEKRKGETIKAMRIYSSELRAVPGYRAITERVYTLYAKLPTR
jgi:hypothetical protein